MAEQIFNAENFVLFLLICTFYLLSLMPCSSTSIVVLCLVQITKYASMFYCRVVRLHLDKMSGAAATPLTKMQRAFLSTPGGSRTCEENIRVTVRIRPLSRREQAMYDLIAWECLDRNTIIYKNPNQERGTAPFVFGISNTICFILDVNWVF